MIGICFAPFLAATAVTGLLWAYAPYLYLKTPPPSKNAAMIDDKRNYIPIVDVIRAVSVGEGERIKSITLRPEPESGRLVYFVNKGSKKGLKEIWVDAETGAVSEPKASAGREFHNWVMKIHRLEFFGTKKELVAIPGTGLLLLLLTGLFLWKRRGPTA